MNTADANFFSKHFFFQIHKKMQTFWKCTDSSAISLVSVQQTPLCPLLNGLQLCTILEKTDHVFENFGEILSTFDTSLANRKQRKTSLLQIFFETFVDFFSKFKKQKCKLFTKYSNSYGISFVILQQSALCSQQNRLSFCAILTKFCKF